MMKIQTLHNVFGRDRAVADDIRVLTKARGVTVINMISGAGAGKTSVLEVSAARIHERFRFAVLEGDIATTRDAERIARLDVPVIQLLTDGGCHLDAPLVFEGVRKLDLDSLDLIFIENVGNLVCPANFDLGEDLRVALLSVAEGDDKPAKYPLLFQKADVVLLTKLDLLPHTDFDVSAANAYIRRVNETAPIIGFSIRTGAGLAEWTEWLTEHVRKATGADRH
jgi:hydrogenase nickel incorporation protein HypB